MHIYFARMYVEDFFYERAMHNYVAEVNVLEGGDLSVPSFLGGQKPYLTS